MYSHFARREEHEIKPRELGVVFQNLRVVGLGATASYAPTMGSIFNPLTIVEAVQKARHPPIRDILNGFEGVVRPGEMLREFLKYNLGDYYLSLSPSQSFSEDPGQVAPHF